MAAVFQFKIFVCKGALYKAVMVQVLVSCLCYKCTIIQQDTSIKAARFEIIIGETLGVLQYLGKTVHYCIGLRLAEKGSLSDFESLEGLPRNDQ